MIKTTDILIDIWNAANSPAIQAISPKTANKKNPNFFINVFIFSE